jgi:hypothetical protein
MMYRRANSTELSRAAKQRRLEAHVSQRPISFHEHSHQAT